MARPNSTIIGRALPQGSGRRTRRVLLLEMHRSIPGLTFTRVRGVRSLRGFARNPRQTVDLPNPEYFFEQRFLAWQAIYGGTRPEYKVWYWLKTRAHLIPGIDFKYQSSKNGGRQEIGGSVADFEIPRQRLLLRVQGERFHLTSRAIQNDLIQKVILTSQGFTVVDIWPHLLDSAEDFVMQSALRGITLQEPRVG